MSANLSANQETIETASRGGQSAEATLYDQRERLRVTLASIGDAVFTTDAEGSVTFLNPAAESLTGWTCHDAKGLPLEAVFRIVHNEDRPPAEMPAAQALQQAARALKASEVRYRRLFETAQDGILILDGDTGKIIDSNPFLSDLLGYSADELLGKELWEIGLFQDIEASRAAFRQLQETGFIRYEDLPLETKDGRRANVESVSNVYPVEGHQVIQCNIRDISDRKRAEEALQQADHRKDEFLAMLAHELRNPLAPLHNAVQVMQLKGTDDRDVQLARDVAERQVQQLTRLVDDLLDVARISRGKIKLQMEPVDLAAVVARAVEISRPLIDAHRHSLEISLPEQAVRVAGDPIRLAQVLANLLNNAAKYTKGSGCIELTVESSGGDSIVRVRDTGVGLAADMLSHIFEMFTQVQGSVGHSEGGLGIGLSLVRSLVEMHGGSVTAHSEGPSYGSEFVVRLPLCVKLLRRLQRWPSRGSTAGCPLEAS